MHQTQFCTRIIAIYSCLNLRVGSVNGFGSDLDLQQGFCKKVLHISHFAQKLKHGTLS
jgi:hypothetical protein